MRCTCYRYQNTKCVPCILLLLNTQTSKNMACSFLSLTPQTLTSPVFWSNKHDLTRRLS